MTWQYHWAWWYAQPEIRIATAEAAVERLQAEMPSHEARAEVAEAERDRLQRVERAVRKGVRMPWFKLGLEHGQLSVVDR